MNGSDNMVRADSMSASDVSALVAARNAASPRELSPLARAVAAEPVPQAISPVVVTGVVRTLEFATIAALGAAIFAFFIYPSDNPSQYVLADIGIAAGAVAAFQACGLYTVQAFRTQIHQLSRIVVAWTIVFV